MLIEKDVVPGKSHRSSWKIRRFLPTIFPIDGVCTRAAVSVRLWIVAREYGIPAVLGSDVATKCIHNGSAITVEGNTGMAIRG